MSEIRGCIVLRFCEGCRSDTSEQGEKRGVGCELERFPKITGAMVNGGNGRKNIGMARKKVQVRY